MGSFRKDDQIAWVYTGTEGYRQASSWKWEFRRASEFSGSSIALKDVVDQPERAPEATIDGTKSFDTFQVSSELPLVVQEPGDKKPWVAEKKVEVVYGSVVRVGPVLICVLDEKQVVSFEEGKLELPIVGEVHSLPKSSRRKGQGRLSLSWKHQRGIAALIALPILALLVVGGWYIFPKAPYPQRVLVAFDGWSGAALRGIQFRVASRLSRDGLEPSFVSPDQLPDELSVEALLHLADKNRASHVLILRNEILQERPGFSKSDVFIASRITSEVGRLGASGVEDGVTLVDQGPRKSEVLERIEARAFPFVMEKAIERIIESPVIDELTKGAEPTPQKFHFYKALRNARCKIREVVRREDLSKLYWCDVSPTEYLESAAELENIQIDQATLLKILPESMSAVLSVRTSGSGWASRFDKHLGDKISSSRIDVLSFETGERRTILYGKSFLGCCGNRPAISDDGKVLVALEGSPNHGRALVKHSFDTESREVIKRIEPNEHISEISLSGDGRYVALLFYQENLEIYGPDNQKVSVGKLELFRDEIAAESHSIRDLVWGQNDLRLKKNGNAPNLFVFFAKLLDPGNHAFLTINPDIVTVSHLKKTYSWPAPRPIGGYGERIFYFRSINQSLLNSPSGEPLCCGDRQEEKIESHDFASGEISEIPLGIDQQFIDGYVAEDGKIYFSMRKIDTDNSCRLMSYDTRLGTLKSVKIGDNTQTLLRMTQFGPGDRVLSHRFAAEDSFDHQKLLTKIHEHINKRCNF